MKFSKKIFPISFAFIGLLGLSSCISVLPKPGKAPLLTSLNSLPKVDNFDATQNSIIIDLPTMPRAFSGNEIAVILDNGSYAFVDGIALTAPAPKSLQNLIIDIFDKSGAFKFAAKSTTSVRADYFLAFDISRFEVSEPKWRKNGIATIEFSARLIDFTSRKPISGKNFLINAPAMRGNALQPARALEAASQNAALETLKWTLIEIEKYQASKAASANK